MIDPGNYITASQLASDIGISPQTASNLLKQVGNGVKIGNTTIYDRKAVVRLVVEKNLKVLNFLGIPLSLVDELYAK